MVHEVEGQPAGHDRPSVSALSAAWRRGQEGWPRRFVVVQFPNPPLIAALAAGAVSRIATGRAADHAEAVAALALGVFAYLELTAGANWLRRALGATVLAGLVVSLAERLG